MATNALTMFNSQGGLPSHIANFFGEEGNIVDTSIKVNSLSYTGKVWAVTVGGEKTKLIKRDADGDEVPLSVMRVVVLDYAKRRGRAYYEGAYDPAKEQAPVCWSDDGVEPDATVPKQTKDTVTSWKCEGCPKSIKGSKITENGKEVTACSQHRMLAVVPAHDLGDKIPPLRLKIAITSDWDKTSPDEATQGKFAFQNYLDFLKTRGVNHTAALVTKISFDSKEAYPKLFFAADRWLDASELAKVAPLTKADDVQKLLGGTYTPAGSDGVPKDIPAATPKSVQADDDDDDGEIVLAGITAPAAEPEPQQAAQKATPRAAKPKPEPEPAAAKAETVAPAALTDDPELAGLLAEWGDD